jgi:hypothetical protein
MYTYQYQFHRLMNYQQDPADLVQTGNNDQEHIFLST